MATTVSLIKELVEGLIKANAARKPNRMFVDTASRTRSLEPIVHVIGSQNEVDVSYTLEMTEVDYVPPAPTE